MPEVYVCTCIYVYVGRDASITSTIANPFFLSVCSVLSVVRKNLQFPNGPIMYYVYSYMYVSKTGELNEYYHRRREEAGGGRGREEEEAGGGPHGRESQNCVNLSAPEPRDRRAAGGGRRPEAGGGGRRRRREEGAGGGGGRREEEEGPMRPISRNIRKNA